VGVSVLGALVGAGVGVMSADAKLADTTPIPAPSASTPEAIATAVFVEPDTVIAPWSRFPTVIGVAEQAWVRFLAITWAEPGRFLSMWAALGGEQAGGLRRRRRRRSTR
jgi:hypothetical protein